MQDRSIGKLLLSLALFGFTAPIAYAEKPPIPERKADVLGHFEKNIETAQEHEQHLQERIEDIKSEIKGTKSKLIGIANSIQKNEKELQKIESDIHALGTERDSLESKLEQDHARISGLVLTLERIRRIPPEALMIKPDAPLGTAQTVLLLKDIIPAINAQTEQYQKDLTHLQELEESLNSKKRSLENKSDKLAEEERALNALISKREKLFASTQKDFAQTQARLKAISQKSRNLRDLVSKIGEENERRRTAGFQQASAASRALPDIEDLKSGVQLPISGAVLVGYGAPDKFGAPSAGISIEGRSNALVIAPMSGVIRFAGNFKHYGNMVIIEHDDGYHSLVAGLGDVHVYMDQPVNVGEPIAKLKKAVNGKLPSLYYELRFKGKAVDPANKFSGLG